VVESLVLLSAFRCSLFALHVHTHEVCCPWRTCLRPKENLATERIPEPASRLEQDHAVGCARAHRGRDPPLWHHTMACYEIALPKEKLVSLKLDIIKVYPRR
jgi:hypothetical protein